MSRKLEYTCDCGTRELLGFCKKCYKHAHYISKRKQYLESAKKRVEEHVQEIKEYKREYYQKNKEEISQKGKEHRIKNSERIKLQRKEYRRKNKEKIRLHGIEYRAKNKDSIRLAKKMYAATHREWSRAQSRKHRKPYAYSRDRQLKYEKGRRNTDKNYAISRNLRIRLSKALKEKCKWVSAVTDLGCSIPELRLYLEAKFKPGMTWDNYGKGGWQVDHIIPLAAFNLECPLQQWVAVRYTNLQPLWEFENKSKGGRVNEEYLYS